MCIRDRYQRRVREQQQNNMGCGSSTQPIKVEENDRQGSGAKPVEQSMLGSAPTTECADLPGEIKSFKEAFDPLTILGDDASKEARMKEWNACDPNGNGHVSLAEVDGWIKGRLQGIHGDDKGETLWRSFRPSYIRAFTDARDIGADTALGGAQATSDDFVQKRAFRVLCAYISIYAQMYAAFSALDGGGADKSDDDRRISREELKAGLDKLGDYDFAAFQNLDDSMADVLFDEIDADGRGFVLLVEWSRYIERKEVEAGTEHSKVLTIGDDDGD
eukprot:TRINITY_DN26976_c0_g1_i1.p1 TRINITY_DN26976_c0_g1~~TRINITY_DN26976_c0_g1_i1.p1  ORF type:complete len:275 (-),score=75.05 TRINITY_DN26976_c0_g1_i1:300-1124(-)